MGIYTSKTSSDRLKLLGQMVEETTEDQKRTLNGRSWGGGGKHSETYTNRKNKYNDDSNLVEFFFFGIQGQHEDIRHLPHNQWQ